MAKVQRVHCDSMFCLTRTPSKPHIIAIMRNDEQINERDITCTDSVTNTYVDGYCNNEA